MKYLRHAGGAGGGGRIAFISDGAVQTGKTLMDGGKENADGAGGLPGTLFIGHPGDVTQFNVSGGDGNAPYFQFIDNNGKVTYFNSIYLFPGNTYEFIASGISSSHPFMIGENYGDMSSNMVTGGPLSGSSGKITVTIPESFDGDLFYFCTNHSAMSQSFNISKPRLEWRWHTINGEETLQVKNILKPSNASFAGMDTTIWTTVYGFSGDPDTYSLNHGNLAGCCCF